MIAAKSTQSLSAGSSVAGSRGRVETPANRLIDNVCAVGSIALVGMAMVFAVQSWIALPVVKVILFALLYLVTRGLVRCLFVLQTRPEVTHVRSTVPSTVLAA
jgi:hypothetical protein